MSLIVGMTCVNTQRAAVCGQFIDIKYAHSVSREYLFGGQRRKVREMLVIDLIELVAIDRPEKMWEFNCANSPRLKDDGDAFDERVEICHLGENIVTENEICLPPGFSQFTSRIDTKEPH